MSDLSPVPLAPIPIRLDGPEYELILSWPFSDPFVGRLLRTEVPDRVRFGRARIWLYRDPDGQPVGFGCLDFCLDYREFTGDRPHPYIPLLR